MRPDFRDACALEVWDFGVTGSGQVGQVLRLERFCVLVYRVKHERICLRKRVMWDITLLEIGTSTLLAAWDTSETILGRE